ncbi:MAG: recombination regulator RecX [Betaproteobacteria bacterium]|nr:recombination regulator RecX [Betaproteobacteria bacterium]MBI3935855.1 recombination regulator RecX [Betaproteobacteria bacterium]
MSKELRARALRLLARREHTRTELARKLAPHADDPGELSALLDELERRGWLSERRAAEQLVHARRGRFGAARIRRDLRDKGVPEEVIAQAVGELKAGELDAARALWQKKFGKAPADARERARQMRFLQGRGFSLEVIRRVVRGEED